ncbi:hypothetical protein [Carnobacterium maltaromaticum]|uniref:hypothetical protein n=1 Tax=Carnobacterium maltaromaticum TaxID=2751 RepID=UPI0012F8D92E|nr:hypothetical protein [Carnobacterium maltaromaticum]
MRETVEYSENQYENGNLLLVSGHTYELRLDTLNNRYFVINQNNELIYLDQIESVATVKSKSSKTVKTSFFYSEKENFFFSDVKKPDHIYFDIFYILLIFILIVFISVIFHCFTN